MSTTEILLTCIFAVVVLDYIESNPRRLSATVRGILARIKVRK